VPMIAVWEGEIVPGTKSDHVSAFWDVMPTVAELAGIQTPENIDGISFLPTLMGKENQKQHDYLYWEFHEKGGRQAVRKGDWKLVRYDVFTPEKTSTELYNLVNDIGEENNVAAENPELVKELLGLMNSSRVDSEDFPFKASVSKK